MPQFGGTATTDNNERQIHRNSILLQAREAGAVLKQVCSYIITSVI